MYVECPLHCFSLISSIHEIIRIGLTKTMNNQDKKTPKPPTSTTETETKTCAQSTLFMAHDSSVILGDNHITLLHIQLTISFRIGRKRTVHF